MAECVLGRLLGRWVVQEKPAGIQVVKEAIFFHGLDGRVQGLDQVRAQGEDEAKLFRAQRVADQLQPVGIGPDVAPARSAAYLAAQ